MSIQRAVIFIKSVPGIFLNLTLLQKFALFSAFLGSISFGYGLYLQLNPTLGIAQAETSIPLNQELRTNDSETTLQATPTGTLAVDISGAVAHPGVYMLAKGQRVSDAVYTAGGFTKKADTRYVNKSINLASVVADAMKIYIPFDGEMIVEKGTESLPESTKKEQTSGSIDTVNANSATLSQLDELKGIGVARAQAIIDNRPYADMTAFAAKSGLSASLVDQLTAQLTF